MVVLSTSTALAAPNDRWRTTQSRTPTRTPTKVATKAVTITKTPTAGIQAKSPTKTSTPRLTRTPTPRRSTKTPTIASATRTPTKTPTSGTTAATSTRTATSVASPTATRTSETAGSTSRTASGPMVIDGKNGVTIENLKISSTSGDCLIIRNSQNITVRNSEIGTCKGNAVVVTGSTNVKIVDSYIHPEFKVTACCDKGDGIFAHTTSGLLIQGNVIAYSESNIMMLGVRDSQVIGNFLLNPMGPFPRGSQVQVWDFAGTRSSNIRIENNYALASTDSQYRFAEGQTDGINIGYTDGAVVRNNYVEGGRYPTGCALIADKSANNVQFTNNTAVDVGQCGIGIAGGKNNVVELNRVYSHGLDRTDVGNVGVYVWNQYPEACGPVTIRNNVLAFIRTDGSFTSMWIGDGCDPVSQTGNTFDQAAVNAMTPVETKLPPPASVPPMPYSTKTMSPFTR